MYDNRKAVFLPAEKRVLENYKGYILHDKMLNLPEDQIQNVETVHEYNLFDSNLFERIAWVLFNIPLIPVAIITITVDVFILRNNRMTSKLKSVSAKTFGLVFRKNVESWQRKTLKPEFEGAVKEDVPVFLTHCRNNKLDVYLYSYLALTDKEQNKIKGLVASGHIKSYYQISNLSDLTPVLLDENISVLNSHLIITDSNEKMKAALLGFNLGSGECRNVELLQERNFEGAGELEWNSSPTFFALAHRISRYPKAKNNAFFNEATIFFIEDEFDSALNAYINQNLDTITAQLKETGKDFVYFPATQSQRNTISGSLLEFLRYQLPVFYSLSDDELTRVLDTALQLTSPVTFYKMVLEELQLPAFERPCLLRMVSRSKREFVSTPIKYSNEDELKVFFDSYIKRKQTEKPGEAFYSIVSPPKDYDADWHFDNESNQFTEEIKEKIDALRKENKHEALVNTILYMLSSIKEDRPDIIEKVKPLLDKRKLLEPNVALSPLVVDKHSNLFLPDFGNKEVKLHALSKALYLLFLRHPNGIRFKELYEHKAELLDIYNKVTNKYDKQEIERAINDMVDMRNPSINQKCARIKEAFCSIMGDHVARYYYITGERGEPRSISLPQELIEFRDK